MKKKDQWKKQQTNPEEITERPPTGDSFREKIPEKKMGKNGDSDLANKKGLLSLLMSFERSIFLQLMRRILRGKLSERARIERGHTCFDSGLSNLELVFTFRL